MINEVQRDAVGITPRIEFTMAQVEPTFYNYKRILKEYRALSVPDVIYVIEGESDVRKVYTTCSKCKGSGTYDSSPTVDQQDNYCYSCNGLGALWLPRPELVVEHLKGVLMGATRAAIGDYLSTRDSRELSRILSDIKGFQKEMSDYWNGIPPRTYSIYQHLIRVGVQVLIKEAVLRVASTLRAHTFTTGELS
jgi:hypothetical protein